MRLTPLGLERSVVEAMGRVTLEFAALEDCIVVWIRFLLSDSFKDSEDAVMCDIFTAEMPFRTRVDVFGALCRHKINKTSRPSEIDDSLKQITQAGSRNNIKKTGQHSVLDDLLKRITQAEESRNAIVHSMWYSTKEPRGVSRSKTRTKRFEGLVTLKQDLSLQEIRTTAKSIAKVREDLIEFTLAVSVLLRRNKPEKKEEQSEVT